MAGFFMIDILNKAYYAMGKTLVPMCVTAGVVAFSFLSNALCSWLFPHQPFLLALGTSAGFLLGGSIMYMGFGRGKAVKMPVKQLVFGVLFSFLMGIGAYVVYNLFIAAETSKVLLVVKCGGVGVIGMVLYLIAMGSMVPTKEILAKLLRRKKA